MSGKRPSLADSLREAVQAETPLPAVPAPAPKPAPAKAQAEPRPAGFYAATRAGKKKVTAALDPAMHKQLKALALNRDTTTEALLAEAITDLFRKHGVPA